MSNVSMCHTRTPKPPSNYPTAPQGSPTNWWGSLFSHHNLALKLSHRSSARCRHAPGDAVRGRGTGARPTAYTPGSGRLPPTCAQRGNFGHVISDMSFRGGLMYKFLALPHWPTLSSRPATHKQETRLRRLLRDILIQCIDCCIRGDRKHPYNHGACSRSVWG